jgi:hypothetical protein
MDTAKQIKKAYLRPAIIVPETEWRTWNGTKYKLSHCFEVLQYIWVDMHLPEYRVAIPENPLEWETDELPFRGSCVETRFLTYVPTGRIVYDNTLPESKAVVWEYRLHHSRDLVKP